MSTQLMANIPTSPLSQQALPAYVTVKPDTLDQVPEVLRQPTQPLTFPLSVQDLKDISVLEQKFDQEEEGAAGLAAPQIGISKRIIVFAVPDDPKLKKFRPDLTQSMPKTIWINPSYTPLGNEQAEDYEACFSVEGVAGRVKRFQKIRYRASTPEGTLVEGTAEGFLARVIQHEIDHLEGILFIDRAEKGSVMGIEEYRRKHQEAFDAEVTSAP